MSIKIHHGPPGSYKTSGAVMDDFIPAAKAGRVVVTNVRGLSDRDKVDEVLGGVPDSFQLIYLPTTEHEDAAANRGYLAKWWHWAPHGALLLIDEAQMIWPKAWKDKDLSALDYPGGLQAANADNRPFDFLTAFDMHRHYGFDLVLTTPNITKIRTDIRGVAEGAFKHKNLATLGIKGMYIEAFHLADDSGASASDFISIRRKRITKQVWDLYESTATGAHSDTLAVSSLFSNPRVLIPLTIMVLSIIFVLSSPLPTFFAPKTGKVHPGSSGPPVLPSPAVSPAAPGPVPKPSMADTPSAKPVPPPPPLDGYKFRLSGYYSDGVTTRLRFHGLSSSGDLHHYSSDDLQALGYKVSIVRNCLAILSFGSSRESVNCDSFPTTSLKPGLAALSDDVGGAISR